VDSLGSQSRQSVNSQDGSDHRPRSQSEVIANRHSSDADIQLVKQEDAKQEKDDVELIIECSPDRPEPKIADALAL
jgi:hypothetical protein